MAAVGLAGTISCFIFGGLFLVFAFIGGFLFVGAWQFPPHVTIILGGIGCALLVGGWWIGSLTTK